MKADQVDLFREYTDLRAVSPDCKRIEVLESLLVKMNQGLIFVVARQYPAIWQYPDEILSVGMTRLLHAVRTFKPELGIFSTYAASLLRSSDGFPSIQRFHACGPIKIPHNAYVSYQAEKVKLAKNPEHEFTAEAQAVESAISNLSRFGEETEGHSLEDVIEQSTFAGASANLEHRQRMNTLCDVLGTLDATERYVLVLVFGLNEDEEAMDLRSAGRELSLSHERVRQIRDKALDRLKKRLVHL